MLYNLLMNLQSYYKIKELLQQNNTTKEERRAFALANKLTDLERFKQLLFWAQNSAHTTTPSNSYAKHIKNILLFISFVVGFLTAVALLGYSGDKPVNVIYFFAFAVVIPLLSMLLSLFALLAPNYLTPLFLTTWIEKILRKISVKSSKILQEDGSVQSAFSLFLVQLSSLLFSVGLLFGFLATILTQDIAFGWSTTLQISPQAFYEFLHSLSFAFAEFCPQSAISLELVEKSHYFRLGQEISQEMQKSAATFGEWWKFLACSTLFYAIFLRLVFVFLSWLKLQKTLKNSLLKLPEARKLLEDMNEPIITTQAQEEEIINEETKSEILYTQAKQEGYSAVLGWTFLDDELLLVMDALGVQAENHFSLGGSKTLKEDTQTIAQLHGDLLLFVKAWEIPTMEFIDILQEIAQKADHVTLSLLGYAKNEYKAKPKDIALWEEKIATQNFDNVSIKI